MNNLTYTECINHVRAFKDFYCLKVIAEKVGMSPAYFRNVINERYGLKNLPEKNRTDFVKFVSMLCSVRQSVPSNMFAYGSDRNLPDELFQSADLSNNQTNNGRAICSNKVERFQAFSLLNNADHFYSRITGHSLSRTTVKAPKRLNESDL